MTRTRLGFGSNGSIELSSAYGYSEQTFLLDQSIFLVLFKIET